MKRVIIESPYAGDIAANEAYLRRAIADSLRRGEAPFASHRFYPGILDDNIPEERRLGMEAGFAWGQVAEICAVYGDLGISSGMREGVGRARDAQIPIVVRWMDCVDAASPAHRRGFRDVLAIHPYLFAECSCGLCRDETR